MRVREEVFFRVRGNNLLQRARCWASCSSRCSCPPLLPPRICLKPCCFLWDPGSVLPWRRSCVSAMSVLPPWNWKCACVRSSCGWPSSRSTVPKARASAKTRPCCWIWSPACRRPRWPLKWAWPWRTRPCPRLDAGTGAGRPAQKEKARHPALRPSASWAARTARASAAGGSHPTMLGSGARRTGGL